jgi:alkylated DNA repair dioxygenase AlkB
MAVYPASKFFTNILQEGDTWVEYFQVLPEHVKLPMRGSPKFDEIWDAHPKEHALVKVYGKELPIPRFQQIYGRSYRFSGMTHEAKPIEEFPHDFLTTLLNYANAHMQSRGFYGKEENKDKKLNGVVVNWYDQGHYIGKHRDGESDLVPGMPIYSFSYGESRDFFLYSDKDGSKTHVCLHHNTMIVMGGTCQKTHKHAVPKRKDSGRRINITLRCFK